MTDDIDLFADEEPDHADYCKKCYEVAPGIFFHQPKTGQDFLDWQARWEKAAQRRKEDEARIRSRTTGRKGRISADSEGDRDLF
jgi:hypothetical protein